MISVKHAIGIIILDLSQLEFDVEKEHCWVQLSGKEVKKNKAMSNETSILSHVFWVHLVTYISMKTYKIFKEIQKVSGYMLLVRYDAFHVPFCLMLI